MQRKLGYMKAMTVNTFGRQLAFRALARMASLAILDPWNQDVGAGRRFFRVVTAQAIHGFMFAMGEFAFRVPRTFNAHWRDAENKHALVIGGLALHGVANAAGFALK